MSTNPEIENSESKGALVTPGQPMDKAIALEQYKLYFERFAEDRRRGDVSTRFFLTINTAIAGMYALILQEQISFNQYEILVILIPALLICTYWFQLFRSWDLMGKAQYEVIEELEDFLPLQPFTYEWVNKLDSGGSYKKKTSIRNYLPAIMGIFYIMLSVYVAFIQR